MVKNTFFNISPRLRKKEDDQRGRTRRRGSEADGQDQKTGSWFKQAQSPNLGHSSWIKNCQPHVGAGYFETPRSLGMTDPFSGNEDPYSCGSKGPQCLVEGGPLLHLPDYPQLLTFHYLVLLQPAEEGQVRPVPGRLQRLQDGLGIQEEQGQEQQHQFCQVSL